MGDAKPVDRTREVKTAQIWAMAFAGMYYASWLLPFIGSRGAFALPYPYPPILIFFALMCLVPSILPKEGRDSRRTDRTLGMIFLFEFIAILVSSLYFGKGFSLLPPVQFYTGSRLALNLTKMWLRVVLGACVVVCFLTRANAVKWALPAYVIVSVVFDSVVVPPNGPAYLAMIENASQRMAEQAATEPSGTYQVAARTIHLTYRITWGYAMYATALVYVFFLRVKTEKVPTQPHHGETT